MRLAPALVISAVFSSALPFLCIPAIKSDCSANVIGTLWPLELVIITGHRWHWAPWWLLVLPVFSRLDVRAYVRWFVGH